MSGLVMFKSYVQPGGMQDVLYSNNQIKFVATLTLYAIRSELDYTMAYDVLDGNTVIAQGTVKINKNIDYGMGMAWGADEKIVTIDGTALKGKTITVYLDPENKITMPGYSKEAHDLYKKATIVIP